MTAGDSTIINFAVQLGKPKYRFVAGIAVLAALGGFLFGFDTGVVAARNRISRRRYTSARSASPGWWARCCWARSAGRPPPGIRPD